VTRVAGHDRRGDLQFVDSFEQSLTCSSGASPNQPEIFVGASIYPAMPSFLLAAQRGLGGVIWRGLR
jgi:hypothetical protein